MFHAFAALFFRGGVKKQSVHKDVQVSLQTSHKKRGKSRTNKTDVSLLSWLSSRWAEICTDPRSAPCSSGLELRAIALCPMAHRFSRDPEHDLPQRLTNIVSLHFSTFAQKASPARQPTHSQSSCAIASPNLPSHLSQNGKVRPLRAETPSDSWETRASRGMSRDNGSLQQSLQWTSQIQVLNWVGSKSWSFW